MLVKSVTGTGLPLPWESGQREIFTPLKPWVCTLIDILFTAVCAAQEEALMPHTEESP